MKRTLEGTNRKRKRTSGFRARMRTPEGLFLTLISTVICIVFPKLLSIILATKTNRTSSRPADLKM